MVGAVLHSTMPRVTINVDEETKRWLEDEADRLNWSLADAGGWCCEVMHSDAGHINPQQSDVKQTDSEHISDRLDELETRIAALEQGSAPSDPHPERPEEPVAPPDREPTADVEAEQDELTIDDHVRERVREVSASWEDSEDRLAARRHAAMLVLQHAADSGEAVGKSSAVVDEARERFPVEGQSRETYWRKNLRPVLKAAGEYSKGAHGYRVE